MSKCCLKYEFKAFPLISHLKMNFFFISWIILWQAWKQSLRFLSEEFCVFLVSFFKFYLQKHMNWYSVCTNIVIFSENVNILYYNTCISLWVYIAWFYNQNVFITMLCFVFKRTITTLYSRIFITYFTERT